MEGIGILHDEFTAPHQPEAGADLIPELGLDLVEVHRQLPVGPQQISGQGRDHFLVGGSQSELATLPILQVEHDPLTGRVAGPAAAALPQLSRLELGQQGLERAGGVEFLPHDRRHLPQHPPEQGQVGVDAAADPADVAGAQQQLVGGDLGLGGVIPQRHQHQAGDAHGIRGAG